MNLNREYACQKNCCGPCQQPYDLGTMMPSETNVNCGSPQCGQMSTMKPENKNHGNDPQHCPQWPTDLPYNMSKNNCSPPADLFNYYPASHQDNDVAIYRNQGGSRSTSNTVHKDLYRQFLECMVDIQIKMFRILRRPNLLYVKKKYIYYNIECQIIGEKSYFEKYPCSGEILTNGIGN